MTELANFFLERYKQWGFPQDPAVRARTTLRVNTLKINVQKIAARLGNKVKLTKVPYLKDSFTAEASFNLVSTPSYLAGEFYLQEAASQIPALVLDPKPGEIVADLCCAPGSKTTQIAQFMENKGQLISVDNNTVRLQKVQHNLERCGVENCLLVRKDALYLGDLGIEFDRILLDAPCSGNYVIDEGWFEKRSIAGVQENARLQKQLILAAFDCLKSGGVLVYATCSLEREEDEEVVEHLLSQRESAVIENIAFPIGSPGLTATTKGTLRMWPTLTGTQGFYVAKIRKN